MNPITGAERKHMDVEQLEGLKHHMKYPEVKENIEIALEDVAYDYLIDESKGKLLTVTEVDNLLSQTTLSKHPLLRMLLKNRLIAEGKMESADKPAHILADIFEAEIDGNVDNRPLRVIAGNGQILPQLQDTKIMREVKDGTHKLTEVATFSHIDEQGNAIYKF